MRYLKFTVKSLLLILTVLLVALPYAAKHGVIYYLQTEKNIETNIDDISINLFTGRINIEGVHLYGETTGELHLGQLLLDLKMTELFQKNILIEEILFTDFTTNVTEQNNAWNVGGITIPTTSESPQELDDAEKKNEASAFDWGYGVKSIAFSSIKINVNSQYTDSNFSLNNLNIVDVMSWRPSNTSKVSLDLSINGQSFNISGGANPFLEEPTIETRVLIDDIQIQPFLKSIKDLPFDQAEVAVYSDIKMDILLREKQLELGMDGEYGLKDIHLKDKVRDIKLDKLSWLGQQNVVLPKQSAKLININGDLNIENIEVKDIENNAHVSQKNILLSGNYQIKLDDTNDLPNIVANTSLTLSKLNINSINDKIKLASFDTWKTGIIEIENLNKINIQNSELTHLTLLDNINKTKAPALTSLEKLKINDIQYQSDLIKIENVELNRLNIDVKLDKNGNIPLLDTISPPPEKSEPETQSTHNINLVEKEDQISTPATPPQQNPMGIIINTILINPNSTIQFVDSSVTPIFDTKLHDLKLSITNINSQNNKELTNIDFNVNIDEYAKFSLNGSATPFSEKANAKLTANLDALELVPLSSYAGKYAGINIKRGTLSLDADIKVKEDILDVNNIFYLNQLNVESDDSTTKNNIFKDMPMPLDLTLDVLRDKNNSIKLEIPVKGKVSDPDFSLQDIYNTAMAKAVKFAAVHYLTQAVQPLGLVLTAGKLIGKATIPKFDPLVFANGTSEVSNTNKKHIKKLAKVLQDKDKLKFTICGTATESDWKVIKAKLKPAESIKKTENDTAVDIRTQALLKLANERTKQVKKVFVETYQISPKRLFTCNGKISEDKKDKSAIPTVEMSL